jgi:hypothetical protein
LGTELLSSGANWGDLKNLGLPAPNLSHEVVVRRARADELTQIIHLRTTSYRHDGKHSGPDAMTDEYDERAIHLCAFFCGCPVASLRLMLPNDGRPSEHQQMIQWPADFPAAMELADISRVCVHPDFRHCRILEALFRRAAAEILLSGRRWLVGSASEKLLPMYRRIGCIPTRIKWANAQCFGGIVHTVFLCDVRSALLGRANPLVWMFLWRDVSRALVQDAVLTPRTLQEWLRLKLIFSAAEFVDFITRY